MIALALVLGCVPDPETPFTTLGVDAVQAMAARADARVSPDERTFLSVPNNDSARAHLHHITSKPHVAGTPGDHEMATYVRDTLRAAGIDAAIDPQRTLLSYPIDRSLDLVDAKGKVVHSAPLAEAILADDPTSDTWWRNHTFNGYSPSGNATGRLVYANFGFPEDFEALKAAGVDINGAVVLMRYGRCFRGLKAMNAETYGAAAALIYSDPEQDGYAKGTVYPDGPWRPPTSVQRGSIQFISICTRAVLDRGRTIAPSPKAPLSTSVRVTRGPNACTSRVALTCGCQARAIRRVHICPTARWRRSAAGSRPISSQRYPCYP